MSAEETYQWLIESSARSIYDGFDLHVVACVLALAMTENYCGTASLSDGVGLEPLALLKLIAEMFPGAKAALEPLIIDGPLVIEDEEQSLRDILGMYSSDISSLERPVAAIIARRCKCPHHLWQDLGLRDRGELSRLMNRHFAKLAERNQHDMKWKKFLYRMVCGSQGFSLCTSPACSECDDYLDCFGAEEGEARLSRADDASEKSA